MAPPRLRLRTSNRSLLLIYLPRKDERLSRPSWPTYSGRFTHINGHPSAAGRPQDRESSQVKDQRSSTVPRSQPTAGLELGLQFGFDYLCMGVPVRGFCTRSVDLLAIVAPDIMTLLAYLLTYVMLTY